MKVIYYKYTGSDVFRYYNYFPRTVRECNSLPSDIVTVKSLDIFKNKLSDYLHCMRRLLENDPPSVLLFIIYYTYYFVFLIIVEFFLFFIIYYFLMLRYNCI